MSKGSAQRPKQISNEEMKKQWDKLFGTTKAKEPPPLPYKTSEWTTLTLKKGK